MSSPCPTSLRTVNPAIEHLRQPAADRQAEAGAAVGARRRIVELPEVLEDLLLIGRRDADAGIGDRQRHACDLCVAPARVIVTLP